MTYRLRSDARRQPIYLILAASLAVLWVSMLASRPLFNPDEGRYAEIPREMLSTGDWLIPHLNGLVYVEKPPLQYWATALCLKLFGHGEFAARLYTALCALATLLAVWLLAHRLWRSAVAWRAAAVLASMLLFSVLGQLLTLDMSLTLYMTWSLVAFVMAQVTPLQAGWRSSQRLWMLSAWAAMACGVLTKGPVAAVVPLAVLTIYTLYARDYAPWRRLQPVAGLLVFCAIAVPWYWLAAHRLADFAQFFFIHEHVARYLTPSADRQAPWWFFIMVLFVGAAPWSVSVGRIIGRGWQRSAPRGQFDAAVFLWIWVVFIVVFYSVSDSKLVPYILPCLPALALLVASSTARSLRREVAASAFLTVMVALALAAAATFGPRSLAAGERSAYFASLAAPLGQVALLLGVSGLSVLARRSRAPTHAVVIMGVGWCLAGMLIMRASARVAPIYSGIQLARAAPSASADAPLFSVGTYDQTLPFYLRRTVTLVAYRGELDFGLRLDPNAALPRLADFIDRWQATPAAYAVMEKRLFADLQRQGVPMRIVASDPRRVMVARE